MLSTKSSKSKKRNSKMGNSIQVPYSGHIPGGIQVGTDVVISGRTLHNSNGFSINLCIGPTYDQDCAMHFNPRFDQNYVARNSMQAGNWGTEDSAGGMPFERNRGFHVHMKVLNHGYQIIVNQRKFCDFNHRLPKEMVKYIYIEGDVMINSIEFRGGHSFPTPAYPPAPAPAYPTAAGYPPAPSYPSAPSYPPQPSMPPAYPPAGMPTGSTVYNPPVPYTAPIHGGLYPGKIIYISGVPNPGVTRFTVNLQCGPSDMYDIALHFDVRFRYNTDFNQVVRTAKHGGNWGPEERDIQFFPFMPNVNFEIMILTEPSGFKIAVNNQHLTQFNHRIQPFQRADHISVVGDVRLTEVRFQ